MVLLLENHDYKYAVEQMLLTLFPAERPVYVDADAGQRPLLRLRLSYGARYVTASARLRMENTSFSAQSRAPLESLAGALERARC